MGKPPADDPLNRVVCRNRKARHEYELLNELECGLVLHGSEVKSIRNNKVSIEEAYVRVKEGEAWLIGCDIAEYPQATYMNHDPKRVRKLLLKTRELRKFAAHAEEKGLTLVPLDVHFTRGYVKVTVAVGRGRQMHDKREALKKRVDQREMDQALKRQRS